MINSITLHCVVKYDFLTISEIPYRNKVMRSTFIHFDAAIRITGMIDFTGQTNVKHKLDFADLKRLRAPRSL